jgi:hypothetical protein
MPETAKAPKAPKALPGTMDAQTHLNTRGRRSRRLRGQRRMARAWAAYYGSIQKADSALNAVYDAYERYNLLYLYQPKGKALLTEALRWAEISLACTCKVYPWPASPELDQALARCARASRSPAEMFKLLYGCSTTKAGESKQRQPPHQTPK